MAVGVHPNPPVTEITGIAVTPKTNNVEVGNTRQLNVAIEPEGAEYDTITYTSSDDAVATVDDNGLVTAVSEGTATITVDVDGVTDTATINAINPED